MCLFELGLLVITDAAQAVLHSLGLTPSTLIERHRLSKQRCSTFTLGNHTVCIVTNATRSLTTILLSHEQPQEH